MCMSDITLGSRKARENLEKIYSKVGDNEFRWSDVADLDLDVTPQFLSGNKILNVVKKDSHCQKIYKIPNGIIKIFRRNNSGSVDILSLITIIVVSAATILIGYILMNGMDKATSSSMTSSVLSTSQNVILNGFGNSSVVLAIGLFALAAVGIVVIFGGILGRDE